MASRTMTPPGTERRFPKAADEIGAIARGVAEGWNDIEMYRITVRQIQRVFHSGTATDRETMLDQRPATTGRSGTQCSQRLSSTWRSSTDTSHPSG